MAKNEEEAAGISTGNKQRPPSCLSLPTTSSASTTTSNGEVVGQKRKGKGCSDKGKRMKISGGSDSSLKAESSRLDPCYGLPPELFRRILSSLTFVSMRHAMLVS